MRWLYLFIFLTSYLCGDLTQLQAEENSTMSNHPIIVLETNQGNIELELRPDIAPKATENFMKLIKDGYYNGIIFHRVIKGFMIQGGDPTGTGRGGDSIWKHSFEDEFSDKIKFDRKGLLAMANAGPNTNGSQFFITTASTSWLDKKHTIFGEVVKGYDIVQKIESVKTVANAPVAPQTILRAYIKEEAHKSDENSHLIQFINSADHR